MSMLDFISIVLELSLQNKLSISVPFVLVNLVGNVILGIRLCASKLSRNSLKSSRSLILSRCILKSPEIITSFLLPSSSRSLANSSINNL